MTKKKRAGQKQSTPHRGRLQRIEEAIHDRVLAAEVAAEEAAAYGSVTAAVEAAEAAVAPEHELGGDDAGGSEPADPTAPPA